MKRPLLLAAVAALAAVVPALGPAAPSKLRNGRISFWSDRAFGGRAQVFTMNSDGSRQRRVTKLFSAKRGDWSPDGRRLVIDGRDRETDFDFDIFVVGANGTGLRKVTRGPERDTQATWSPDGRSIAFTRTESEGGAQSLWIVGADGTGAQRVADGGPAAWSPDGRRLAVGGFGLRLVKAGGSGEQRLVSGEAEVAAWSADGRRILFTSWRDGNPEVYVVRADGTRLRRLTRRPGEDYAADFSPDGRKILFSSDRTGTKQVYVMSLDGSGIRNLSRSRSSDWATSWQSLR
jgi:Tol biopolymer transport system component